MKCNIDNSTCNRRNRCLTHLALKCKKIVLIRNDSQNLESCRDWQKFIFSNEENNSVSYLEMLAAPYEDGSGRFGRCWPWSTRWCGEYSPLRSSRKALCGSSCHADASDSADFYVNDGDVPMGGLTASVREMLSKISHCGNFTALRRRNSWWR